MKEQEKQEQIRKYLASKSLAELIDELGFYKDLANELKADNELGYCTALKQIKIIETEMSKRWF